MVTITLSLQEAEEQIKQAILDHSPYAHSIILSVLLKVNYKYGTLRHNQLVRKFGLKEQFGIHPRPTFPKNVD